MMPACQGRTATDELHGPAASASRSSRRRASCGGSPPRWTGTARSAPSPAACSRRRARRCCSRTSRAIATGRCTRLLTGGLGDRRRLALALGFPKDAPNRELVQHVMKKNRETIAPVIVRTGPVKEHVLRGAEVDQTVFPGPEVELPRGRPVHPHVLGDRHAGPRHARDERRDLSRDDRAAGHVADAADQGRPALGRSTS